MALTTLAAVKTHLGLSDTGEDVPLSQWIAGASAAIRRHVDDYLYGAIGQISSGSAAIVTSPGHGLETGATITIAGSDSVPTIDGPRSITVLDDQTFSIPVAITTPGTRGVFSRTYTEFCGGNGTSELRLMHIPVQSVQGVWLDPSGYFGDPTNAFAADTELTQGIDYALWRDDAADSGVSHRGALVRIDGAVWPRPSARVAGLLASAPGTAYGNIKVVYTAGYLHIPPEAQLAANQLVAQIRKGALDGGSLHSERYDYYSYERLTPADEAQLLSSVSSLLRRYKKWTW